MMNKNIHKLYMFLCALAAACFLSGCSATELENKSFPLAVLINEKDGQYQACYLSQQLSEVANERADGGNMTAESAQGSTYYETHNTFEKNNRCRLDMSHTKALIFRNDFIESDTFEVFLETVRRENTYARNTLVYLSDSSMGQLAKLNRSLEVPLGSYLEQMTENERELKEQAAVTLGTLLNEQANASRTILIPVIQEENGLPAVYAYEVLQNFEPKGRIRTEEAQIYYLLAGQLERMDVQLDKNDQVRLSHLKCRRNFILSAGEVTQQLILTAEAEQVSGKASEEEIEQAVKDKIERACRVSCQLQGIDLSDSSRCLAMLAPDVYDEYRDRIDEYMENLNYEAKVQVKTVSG